MRQRLVSLRYPIAWPVAPPREASGWIVALGFLGAHLVLPRLVPGLAKPVSLVFLALAPLLAAAACLMHRRGRGWTALVVALGLWSGGMVADLYEYLVPGTASGETSLSMLLFVLYGVPIIFTTASPASEHWPVRVVDAVLALALGLLFFVHTLSYATMAGSSPDGAANLRLMFDIENLFVAGFALMRFVTSRAPHDRDLFGVLSLFAAAYMVVAAYINHMQETADYGGMVDILIDLPFIVLLLLVWRRPGPRHDRAGLSASHERLAQAVSPLMLPATLLAVAAVLLHAHPRWAVAGFATATLVYGLRNVLSHLRNLAERDRLSLLSQSDPLTALPNRRRFDDVLCREWARARRADTGLALLMIDIDHFKLLNDTMGHPRGDQYLCAVAAALAGCARRTSDLVARYGGEEFVAILPATSAEQAAELAEIMRLRVLDLALASPAPIGRVSVSIGVGHLARIGGEDPETLLGYADRALYVAKHDGRNRVRTLTLGS